MKYSMTEQEHADFSYRWVVNLRWVHGLVWLYMGLLQTNIRTKTFSSLQKQNIGHDMCFTLLVTHQRLVKSVWDKRPFSECTSWFLQYLMRAMSSLGLVSPLGGNVSKPNLGCGKLPKFLSRHTIKVKSKSFEETGTAVKRIDHLLFVTKTKCKENWFRWKTPKTIYIILVKYEIKKSKN